MLIFDLILLFLFLGWIAHERFPVYDDMEIVFSNYKGKNMSEAVLKLDDNGVSATLAFKDKKGNQASVFGAPVWTLSADGVVTPTVAPDGLSASFAPAGVGSVTVTVVAQATETVGEAPITATGTITVGAAAAATGEIVFGPVT